MLESISWSEFVLYLLGGCATYYAILLLIGKVSLKRNLGISNSKLFNKENTIKRKWKPEEPDEDDEGSIDEEIRGEESPENDQTFTSLEALADEVQTIIEKSSSIDITKEQLLLELRKEIARYPTLNVPAFRAAISNLITKSARQECSIEVSKQEADALWSGL